MTTPHDEIPGAWCDEAPAARRKTVLIADDDDDMRALVATVMRHDGFEVLEARDGAEMVELLEAMDRPSRRPDFIVTDVLMPGLSGLSILNVLRRAPWNVPILVITALGPQTFHDYARKLGATSTLRKPFDAEALRIAIVDAFLLHCADELPRAYAVQGVQGESDQGPDEAKKGAASNVV